ncbi:MAG: tetratricopeptide repeat protein [Burkholderiaceae bacterium]
MSPGYTYPPADPAIADIVERLTENLAAMPDLIQQFSADLLQGKSLGECRGIAAHELDSLYQLAQSLCNEEQFAHALPICLNLLIHQPANPDYLFISASCLQRLSQHKEAAQLFQQLCQLDVLHVAAAYRLGECMEALGDREAAKVQFNRCIDLSYGDDRYRHLQTFAKDKISRYN